MVASIFPKFIYAGRSPVTKQLIKSSIPGAAISSAATLLFTGNPIAAGAVGIADLVGSAGIARGLHGTKWGGGQMLRTIKKNSPTSTSIGPEFYQTSLPQNIGIMGTSFLAPTIERLPIFAGQKNVQQQQLAQMKYMNDLDPITSNDTLYQLQGVPMREV